MEPHARIQKVFFRGGPTFFSLMSGKTGPSLARQRKWRFGGAPMMALNGVSLACR